MVLIRIKTPLCAIFGAPTSSLLNTDGKSDFLVDSGFWNSTRPKPILGGSSDLQLVRTALISLLTAGASYMRPLRETLSCKLDDKPSQK